MRPSALGALRRLSTTAGNATFSSGEIHAKLQLHNCTVSSVSDAERLSILSTTRGLVVKMVVIRLPSRSSDPFETAIDGMANVSGPFVAYSWTTLLSTDRYPSTRTDLVGSRIGRFVGLADDQFGNVQITDE